MKEAGKASHHMPPDSVSPVDREFGPAIQMEKTDHYSTPSYGRSTRAPYMTEQGERAAGGNFMGAFNVDAAAVEAKFPGKYSGAIVQARAYAECLKKTGNAN